MKIVNVIDQINQEELNIAQFIKEAFNDLAELSVAATIEEKIKYNSNIAINSLKHIGFESATNAKQVIFKIIKVLNKDAMQEHVENPAKLKDLIDSKTSVDDKVANDAIMSIVTNISMTTIASIKQYVNIMTDDALTSAQMNDILAKILRLNEIRVIVHYNEMQKYEYYGVLTMLLIGILVNIEVMGFDAPLVLECTLKGEDYSKCKKQAND